MDAVFPILIFTEVIMHYLIKHPAFILVAIMVIAINFYVTKPYSDSTHELINISPYSSINGQNAAPESAEVVQDYALATGAWIPSPMSVQSTAPAQNAESAEVVQDYALATGAWIPSRSN